MTPNLGATQFLAKFAPPCETIFEWRSIFLSRKGVRRFYPMVNLFLLRLLPIPLS